MSASDTPVKDQTPRDQYTASSNQTTFDYNFLIFDKADIVVEETTDPGTDSEATTTLTEGTDYSVSGVGEADGGSITLTSGADKDDRYTLYRETTIERLTDFLQSGDFKAEDINTELDTLVQILQEKQLEIDRAVTLAKSDELDSLELPESIGDAAIAFNEAGDDLVTVPLTDKPFAEFIDDENLIFGSDSDYLLRYDSGNDWIEIYDNENDVDVIRFKRNGDFEFPNQNIESKFDHGDVGGLGDDDHTQYLNSSRHDSEDHQSALQSTFTLSSGEIIEFNGTNLVTTQWNALNTSYDNSNSNLDETDVKNALDELDSEKADVGSSISQSRLQPDFLAVDEKSAGTNGGSSVSGRQTRDLNTIRRNNISGASLSSNQISLDSGDYYFEAQAPARIPRRHKAYLKNVTDSSISIVGSNSYDGGNGQQVHSHLHGTVSISSTKNFEIISYIEDSNSTIGLGVATSDSTVEIYTEVKIWEVS